MVLMNIQSSSLVSYNSIDWLKLYTAEIIITVKF